MQVLGIADDTTGALEVGSQFAAAGLRCSVTLERGVKANSPGLVEAVHTRHVAPEKARYRVAYRAASARKAGIPFLYKKTDSTLRGNIASEFQGLLDVYPDKTVLYAPAYPALGRAVINGQLYVDNIPLARTAFAADALNPAVEGSIPELLRRGCEVPVLLAGTAQELETILSRGAPGSIVVCDGKANRDLKWAAAAAGRFASSCIAAGTGGFCGPWLRALPVERGFHCRGPYVQRCLVVSGSRHPASKGQVEQAAAAGLPTLYLGPDARTDDALSGELNAALASQEWAALVSPGTCLEDVAERMGELAARACRAAPLDGLVIFGGDTARAVLRALGVARIRSCRELLPGVPFSIIRLGMRELALVSKAGGFGSSGALLAIREHLERGL